jgi:hypothetical protein
VPLRTLLLAVLLAPAPATAQLRPVEPLNWQLLEPGTTVAAALGAGVLWRQRATLAGVEGTLLELGNFAAGWHTGRVGLEVSGTVVRRFRDRAAYRPAGFGAGGPPADGVRRDAGDFRAAALVLLAGDVATRGLALRFGTRLPTTDERIGLDRDRTDFFATLGARTRLGGLLLSGESGIGINGTRVPEHDQSDVWIFSAAAAYVGGPLTPSVSIVGHQDGHAYVIVGNEDLRELRLGVRAGGRGWLDAAWLYGLAPSSPAHGLLVRAGLTF